MTRAAATLVMALGVAVIGGSIAGGIALASGSHGEDAPAVSDNTEVPGSNVPSTAPEPGDDRHGDEAVCEPGDDCGGAIGTAPTPSADDDDGPDDRGHGEDDGVEDDHDDDLHDD
jgi:hypothetical protein